MQADDVRDVKGVCNLSEEMSGVNGGERRCSFIHLHSIFPVAFVISVLDTRAEFPPQTDLSALIPCFISQSALLMAGVLNWLSKKTLSTILDSKKTFTFELQ